MNSAIIKELRTLVEANVISQETADTIKGYYQQKKEDSNRFPVILSILGSILVGLGIVLVIAHNWDQFNRLVKTIIAFVPLVLSQALCFYVLRKKTDNIAWKESAAALLFFSVGTSISLVSQTYHVSGTVEGFLFTWMLLTVPLVYLLSSFVVTLLYIGGITTYACLLGYGYPAEEPYWYFILLLILLPAYLRLFKTRPEGNAIRIMNWLLAISFACCFASFTDSGVKYELINIGYLSLFCFYYVIGSRQTQKDGRVFSNAFFMIGLGGILFMLFLWSFDWLWKDTEHGFGTLNFSSPFPYISILCLLLVAYFISKKFKHEGMGGLDPTGISVFILGLTIILFNKYPGIGTLITNLWLLLISLYYIRKGSQRYHLGILNFGLIILSALALLRFFDDSIPFVWRGIIFLLTGISVIAANLIIIKRKKAIAAKQGI